MNHLENLSENDEIKKEKSLCCMKAFVRDSSIFLIAASARLFNRRINQCQFVERKESNYYGWECFHELTSEQNIGHPNIMYTI